MFSQNIEIHPYMSRPLRNMTTFYIQQWDIFWVSRNYPRLGVGNGFSFWKKSKVVFCSELVSLPRNGFIGTALREIVSIFFCTERNFIPRNGSEWNSKSLLLFWFQFARRWGQINWYSVRRWKKYFALGWPEQARSNKNLLYRHDWPNKPTNPPWKDPLYLYSLSRHSPRFQQSAGATSL